MDLTIVCVTHYCQLMSTDDSAAEAATDKLTLELRRGMLTLAALAALRTEGYGYALQQRLSGRGLDIEQGTLYPLLRRLDEQGLLDSDWNVEGARPRKYYRLSPAGRRVLERLQTEWLDLIEVVGGLLDDRPTDDEEDRAGD